jgi:hypothetical protein
LEKLKIWLKPLLTILAYKKCRNICGSLKLVCHQNNSKNWCLKNCDNICWPLAIKEDYLTKILTLLKQNILSFFQGHFYWPEKTFRNQIKYRKWYIFHNYFFLWETTFAWSRTQSPYF